MSEPYLNQDNPYQFNPDLPPNEFNAQLGNALFRIIEAAFANPLNQMNRIGGQAEGQIPVFDPTLEYNDVYQNAGYNDWQSALLAMGTGIAEPGPDFGSVDNAVGAIDPSMIEAASKALPLLFRKAIAGGGTAVAEGDVAKQVYHATTSGDFPRFNVGLAGSGTGGKQHGDVLFFAEDPQQALNASANAAGSAKGTNIRPSYMNIKNPFYQDEPLTPEMTNALEAYINNTYDGYMKDEAMQALAMLKDPNKVFPNGSWAEDGVYQALRHGVFKGDGNAANKFIQSQGYDGMFHKSTEGNAGNKNVWMAFQPDQILNYDDIELAGALAIQQGLLKEGTPEYDEFLKLVDQRTAQGVDATSNQLLNPSFKDASPYSPKFLSEPYKPPTLTNIEDIGYGSIGNIGNSSMSYNDLFNEYSKAESINNLTTNPAYLDYIVEGFEQWFDGDTDKSYELATKLFTDIISNKSYAESITDIGSAEKAVLALAKEKGISLDESAKMLDAYAFNNKIDLMDNGDNLVNEAAYNLYNKPATVAKLDPTASLGKNVFGESSYNDILVNAGIEGLDEFVKAFDSDTFEEALSALPYESISEFKTMLDNDLAKVAGIRESINSTKDFDANELVDIFSGNKAAAANLVKEWEYQGYLDDLSEEQTNYILSKIDYVVNGNVPSGDYNSSFKNFWENTLGNGSTPQMAGYVSVGDFYDALSDNMFDANALSSISNNKDDFLTLVQGFASEYNVYAFAPGMESTIEEGMQIASDLADKVSKGAVDEATAIESIKEIMGVIKNEIATKVGE